MGSRVVMFPARSARGAGNPYIEQSNHLKPHRRMAESGPHPTIEWSNRRYELWHPPSQGRITRVDPPAGGSNCDLTLPTAGWSNALSASPVYRDRLSGPGGNPPSNGQI